MTRDTMKAVQILEPICKELFISIDADDSLLYLNEQPIGIACNSTGATIMEALAYIFMERYPRFRPSAKISSALERDIKRYWVDPQTVEKMRWMNNDKTGT